MDILEQIFYGNKNTTLKRCIKQIPILFLIISPQLTKQSNSIDITKCILEHKSFNLVTICTQCKEICFKYLCLGLVYYVNSYLMNKLI